MRKFAIDTQSSRFFGPCGVLQLNLWAISHRLAVMTSPFMCVDLNGIHLTWLSPEKCHNQDCENDLNDSPYLALEKCLNQDCENVGK